ncbi:TlpA family protein disulfide reductase [Melioribacteraceae bacterium 4301-Me]|uniref:TlpA family protein disulfide reductase n=1 Tax=Pyranulibacter aquaticus TaxID=3163344 RepID=UPI0035953581
MKPTSLKPKAGLAFEIFFPLISLFATFFIVFLFNTHIIAQTTIVKGKLLDEEGKPSRYSLVGIAPSEYANAANFVGCDEEGNYKISLKNSGFNFVLYSMPNHNPLRVPILNNKNKEVTINVNLVPYEFKDNLDEVGIAGSFNNFNIGSPEKMIKKEDGTFLFEVKTDQDEIKYQLCGIEKNGRSINAPLSSSFEPDSSGDYISIAKVKDGKAVIVFDPANLLKKKAEPNVSFNKNSIDEKICNLFSEHKRISQDISNKMETYLKAKGNIQNFQYENTNYLDGLLNKIESEKEKEVKDCLKLFYISFAPYKMKNYNREKATSFFESLLPQNEIWELIPNAFFSLYALFPQHKWNEIQNNFLKNSKSVTLKSNIFGYKLSLAKQKGDEEELKKLHTLISNEYKDVKELQNILKYYPIETKIKTGAKIPDFEVKSLDNPNEVYSKQSMLGKIYMIDFWATWCGPCVGEMKNLHKAYEKFKDKGFEILSLSLDAKPEDVFKFREEKWKMPWKNAFLEGGWQNPVCKKFEVVAIPEPILVGADGKILAYGGELRGESLEKTLSIYFKRHLKN